MRTRTGSDAFVFGDDLHGEVVAHGFTYDLPTNAETAPAPGQCAIEMCGHNATHQQKFRISDEGTVRAGSILLCKEHALGGGLEPCGVIDEAITKLK